MGTITKALEMLNYYSSSRPEISLTRFVSLSGRDKATVHRHLVELSENGFLEQDLKTRSYRLGVKILQLAALREITHPLRTVAEPVVNQIAEHVGELVHFSILQGKAIQPVCHHDPRIHGTHVNYDPSEILPLHATSTGLAVLAYRSDDEILELISGKLKAYTNHTITSHDHLIAIIGHIRKSGFSYINKAFDIEVCSRGTPIFNSDGIAIGALSIAVPDIRMGEEREHIFKSALAEGALKLTNVTGGIVPDNLRILWNENI